MLIGDVNSDVQTGLCMALMSNILTKTRSGIFMSSVPPYVCDLQLTNCVASSSFSKLDKDEISILPLMMFLNLTKRSNTCVITRLIVMVI